MQNCRLGVLLLSVVFLTTGSLLHAQVLNNEGAVINVTTNTVVDGGDLENSTGDLENEGTINLSGDFTNDDAVRGSGFYNLFGDWTNNSWFDANSSTVHFQGTGLQDYRNVSGDRFYNVRFSNSGAISNSLKLYHSLEVDNQLNLDSGLVEFDNAADKVFLRNYASNSLIYVDGRIIGKFERRINSDDNYLFPIGSEANYNPVNLDPNETPMQGSVLSEFFDADPGDADLPIVDYTDDTVEIYDAFPEGYWSLVANEGFATNDFNLSLGGNGFNGIQDITRVIKRDAPAGDWQVDGAHSDVTDATTANRESLIGGISATGNQFGLGRARPHIRIQPENDTVCEAHELFDFDEDGDFTGIYAEFKVRASGRGLLRYQWQILESAAWVDIDETYWDFETYEDPDRRNMDVIPYLRLDGNQYRVVITDRNDNDKISDTITLVVEPLPTAVATPEFAVICNLDTTNIELTATMPSTYIPAGTFFEVRVLYSGVITGTADIVAPLAEGYRIEQALINPSLSVDSVIYEIVPYGPNTIACEGYADTITIWVNPTPDISVLIPDPLICNDGSTELQITNLNPDIRGSWNYELVVTTDPSVSGYIADGDYQPSTFTSSFTETLNNASSTTKSVVYTFQPFIIPDGAAPRCYYPSVNLTIDSILVLPTPDILVDIPDTVICNEGNTTIAISTPNTTEQLYGDWYYDLTIVADDEIGSPDNSLDERRIPEGGLNLNLTNYSDTVRAVTYYFHPVIEPEDGDDDCHNGVPNDTSITIFVNPTPRLFLQVPVSPVTGEQIYCNGTTVPFTVQNTQEFLGSPEFDMDVYQYGTIQYYSGGGTSTYGIDISSGDASFDRTLSHTNDTIWSIYYRFTPYIEDLAGLRTCNGVIDTIEIEMVPVLRSFVSEADTVFGGFSVACNGDEDGIIHMAPVGGDLRYNYAIEWRENDAAGSILQETAYVRSDSLENLSKGIYYFSITDTLGCFFDTTWNIIEPDILEIYQDDPQGPACYNGTNDGFILLDAQGGAETYPYNYLWYDITRSRVVADITTTGRGDLLEAYTREYSVTITDVNQCVTYREYELDSPGLLESSLSYLKTYPDNKPRYQSGEILAYDVSCTGLTDSEVEITAIEGTAGYRYYWFTAEDTMRMAAYEEDVRKVSGLPAGDYFYMIRDANNCTEEDTLQAFSINEPDPITFNWIDETYNGGWQIQCNDSTNGKISLNYDGGHFATQRHNYTWTGPGVIDGEPGQTNLAAGTYTLHVEDTTGWCSADTTFILEKPTAIQYDTLPRMYAGDWNVSCYGLSNGEIVLDNLQGSGPMGDEGDGPEDYTYWWTPMNGTSLSDSSLQNQAGLSVGKYKFRITDAIGCYVEDSLTLSQPDSLFAVPDTSYYNGYEIACYDGEDGWVSATTFGGTRPYTYEWTEQGGISDTLINNLTVGDYSVIISDPNGCLDTLEWTLGYPDTLVLNPSAIDLIECYGDTSSLRISPVGGVEPYIYTWDGTIGDSALNGVEDGKYHILLEDANGCVVEDTLELTQRSRIMPEIIVTSDYNGREISCYGLSDAEIELLVSGGNDSQYTFEWSTEANNDNEHIISGLPAGIYSVVGQDGSGCVFDTSYTVVQPDSITLNYRAVNPLCFADSNGVITIAPIGGTPFNSSPAYNYSLNGESSLPSPEFSGLKEGIYEVLVSDINNCITSRTIYLDDPDPLFMEYDSVNAECPDESDGSLTIRNIYGGTWPYTVNDGQIWDFQGIPPGDFIINIIDDHHCVLTDTVHIGTIFSSCLIIPNAFTPNGDGINDVWMLDEDENGSDMYLYPDAELTIFNRWGEVVYYSNNVANEPWDGTYKGRDLPIDSYHYVLDLKNGDPPITGNVTILKGDPTQ